VWCNAAPELDGESDGGGVEGYGVVVGRVSMGLNLNPHPLKAEGAAPSKNSLE
jgi:hypothetical protein